MGVGDKETWKTIEERRDGVAREKIKRGKKRGESVQKDAEADLWRL